MLMHVYAVHTECPFHHLWLGLSVACYAQALEGALCTLSCTYVDNGSCLQSVGGVLSSPTSEDHAHFSSHRWDVVLSSSSHGESYYYHHLFMAGGSFNYHPIPSSESSYIHTVLFPQVFQLLSSPSHGVSCYHYTLLTGGIFYHHPLPTGGTCYYR